MFELNQVTKHYGNAVALRSVSLRIAAGKTTALIGSSGSGKSTLLKVMLGLIAPDSGSVRFGIQDRVEMRRTAAPALRKQMGYVIQDGGLFPHLTAAENIFLLARHLGWRPENLHARLDELLTLTRLSPDLLKRYPAELSGGQKQRVSLMRALMLNPGVLLLDEPLGALDPIVRADLQADLKRIFQSLQKTVVLVTHDIGEAAFFAETLVLMNEGRVVQQGSLESLVRSPQEAFVTRFINAQRSPLEPLKTERSE